MIIKAGYTITYQSWENDGDNYRNHRFEGLTKEEVEDKIEFLKIFLSENNRSKGELKTFGNNTDTIDFLEVYEIHKPNLIKKILQQDDPSFLIALDKWIETEDVFELTKYNLTSDELSDTLSDCFYSEIYEHLGGSEYYNARVYNNDAQVFYTPVDLILQEISDQFNVK